MGTRRGVVYAKVERLADDVRREASISNPSPMPKGTPPETLNIKDLVATCRLPTQPQPCNLGPIRYREFESTPCARTLGFPRLLAHIAASTAYLPNKGGAFDSVAPFALAHGRDLCCPSVGEKGGDWSDHVVVEAVD